MLYDVMVLLGEFPLHSTDILLGDKMVSYLLFQHLSLVQRLGKDEETRGKSVQSVDGCVGEGECEGKCEG